MTLAPPPATAEAPGAGLPPLLLPPALRLSHEQFALVCDANPEAVLELAADGHLIAMTPTGGDTGRRNSRLIARLQTWADQQGGWEVFDSSTGFRLADGSVACNPAGRSGAPAGAAVGAGGALGGVTRS
jgi:Uma2 family endonuclease